MKLRTCSDRDHIPALDSWRGPAEVMGVEKTDQHDAMLHSIPLTYPELLAGQ